MTRPTLKNQRKKYRRRPPKPPPRKPKPKRKPKPQPDRKRWFQILATAIALAISKVLRGSA